MSRLRPVRAEVLKLTTTRLPWGFLAVLLVVSATTGAAVLLGAEADGTKGFVATAADQQSLVAFGANAMMIAALFGAIAVAREYAHGTVVPTFLVTPRRHRAVLAQTTALAMAGSVIGLVGAALTVVAVAVTVPLVDHEFLMGAGAVTRVVAASAFSGTVGALVGAGVGLVVRNTGGAVTTVVVLLSIVPPIAVQLVHDAVRWLPSTLANALSGVVPDPSPLGALLALAALAVVPVVVGLVLVQRRDVV